MKKAGVTDGGIALVEALVTLIDERWPTRQALLDALGAAGVKAGLDRKRLSKELGSGDKPRGPDWHIAELIAGGCVGDPARLQQVLEQLAGLYCAARGEDRPPGYKGLISRPAGSGSANEGDTALHEVIDRLQRELDNKISSLEELRSLHEGAFQKVGEQQMHLDRQRRRTQAVEEELAAARTQNTARVQEVKALSAQVTTLTTQVVANQAARAQLAEKGAQLAEKEAEISGLSQEVMHQSAQTVQIRAQRDEARRTIAVQQRGLHDADAKLKAHRLRDAAALQRHSNLRERYARLAAQVEFAHETTTESAADVAARGVRLGDTTLTVDPAANGPYRALAMYLLTHLEYSGRSPAQIPLPSRPEWPQLRDVLTAHALPAPQQLAGLARLIGAEITHARLLYDDAAASMSPALPTATPGEAPPPVLDDYESIVIGIDRDNTEPADGETVRLSAVVTRSPGDSDTPPPPCGDTGDTTVAALSPATGDSAVTNGGDDLLTPIRVSGADTTLYRSQRYQHQLRRHRWTLRAVTAAGAMLIPLAFTTATAKAMPLNARIAALIGVAACFTCWAIALGSARLLRRRRYRGRHCPGDSSGQPATVTGRATPATAKTADIVPGPASTTETALAGLAPVAAVEVPIELSPQISTTQIRATMSQALTGRQISRQVGTEQTAASTPDNPERAARQVRRLPGRPAGPRRPGQPPGPRPSDERAPRHPSG